MTNSPAMVADEASARRKGPVGLLLVVLLVLGCGGYLAYRQFYQTYHLATVQEGVLYRDGSHSELEFEHAIARVRPKTVVSLNDDAELADPSKGQLASEESTLRILGIGSRRIAVKLGGWPASEDLQRFLKTVNDPAARPVLVHCAQGVRRTGMFVAAYQMSVQGYDKEKAKAAILAFGHSEKTIADIKRFIDAYDPGRQELTQALGAAAAKD